MENENEYQDVEETVDDEESTEETTDWEAKAKELEKNLGMTKRELSKLKKQSETKTEKKTEKKSNEGLDYGQKAFLLANGVKGKKEIEFVEEHLESSGKDLEDLLENQYFQKSLEDFREENKINNAIPKDGKRSNTPTQDTVDYWVNKGELPPADQVELRRQVVNAKIKSKTDGSKFTSTPVVK